LIALSQVFQGNVELDRYPARARFKTRSNHRQQANASTSAHHPIKLSVSWIRLWMTTRFWWRRRRFVALRHTPCPANRFPWLDPERSARSVVEIRLGAKLVFPDHDVWIIYGDGSAVTA